MGISRDSRHKRRATGGRKANLKKKRLYESGRPPAMTKLGPSRIHELRVRGGNMKFRAMRLDHGNFSWGSEVISRKTRILDVVYNASNNELVRTKTLVKNCIVQIDAAPFKTWYEAHYGVKIGLKKLKKSETTEDVKKSKSVLKKLEERQKTRTLDPALDDSFSSGRLYACLSSRPGQSGRADGYILEGKELDFYTKALKKRKGAK
jgi:small subunit ribosomal protein S8e